MYIDEKEQKTILRDGEKLLRTFLVFSKELLREDINDYFIRELMIRDSKELGNTADEICAKLLDIIIKKFKLKKRDRVNEVELLHFRGATIDLNTITLTRTEKNKKVELDYIKKDCGIIYFECEENHKVAFELMELYKLQDIAPLLWTLYFFQYQSMQRGKRGKK